MIRALIAEDEAPARDKLRRWLAAHEDIEVVVEAADGLAAAAAIADLNPHVAFLDIQMPGMNGLEVAAQLGNSERLLVPQGETLQLLDVALIHWLEADDNYVHVHAAHTRYILRRTLADLLAQPGEHRFVRIHKSAAVNLAEVKSLSPLFKGDHDITLHSGATLRLSRRYKDALFARMGR